MLGCKYIPLIRKDETCKIFVEDILLVEQNLRKIVIYTDEGKHWRYGKLDELLKHLDERFFKCHGSCIINMSKVISMKEQTIIFENGFKITMGRVNFRYAKQNFARFMIRETSGV